MPTENLAILKTGLEVVTAAKDMAQRDKPDHRLNDQICRALRTLYFTPKGILTLLKELENNDGALGDDLRDRLVNFNNREWKVGRALDAIRFRPLAAGSPA